MDKPKILYKYRAVSENTEKIFTNKMIWLSKPENLNDPFECSIANFTDRAKKKMIQKYKILQVRNFAVFGAKFYHEGRAFYGLRGKSLSSFLKRLNSKTWERRYQMVNDVVHEATGTLFSNPNHIIASLESRLHDTGIFSLSETDTNQLMWAHYARDCRKILRKFITN
jgi:hypothetical protein